MRGKSEARNRKEPGGAPELRRSLCQPCRRVTILTMKLSARTLAIQTPFALVLAVLMLAGCASTGVRPEFPPGTDFGRYHTFAVLPVGQERPAGAPRIPANIVAAATNAVVQTLTGKGLREAGEADADLLVDLSGDAVSLPEHYMHRPAFTDQGVVSVYYVNSTLPQLRSRCTVVVELIDRPARQVVWRATQTEELTAQPGAATVARMIRDVLSAYPSLGH